MQLFFATFLIFSCCTAIFFSSLFISFLLLSLFFYNFVFLDGHFPISLFTFRRFCSFPCSCPLPIFIFHHFILPFFVNSCHHEAQLLPDYAFFLFGFFSIYLISYKSHHDGLYHSKEAFFCFKKFICMKFCFLFLSCIWHSVFHRAGTSFVILFHHIFPVFIAFSFYVFFFDQHPCCQTQFFCSVAYFLCFLSFFILFLLYLFCL